MFLMKSLLKQAVLFHGSQEDEEKQPGLSSEFLTFFFFPGHRYLYIYIILTFSYFTCWLLFVFFKLKIIILSCNTSQAHFFFSKFFPVPLSLRSTHCSQTFLWTTISQIMAWKLIRPISAHLCDTMRLMTFTSQLGCFASSVSCWWLTSSSQCPRYPENPT